MQALIRIVLPIAVLGLPVLAEVVSGASAADGAEDLTISGTVELPDALIDKVDPADRLVLKLYYPEDGIEKDTRYWIVDDATFPRAFEIAPSTDMNGRARWPSYRLDVFTDRDRNVLNLVAGELFASSNNLLPLSTTDVVLELSNPAEIK